MTNQPARTGEFETIEKYLAPLAQGFAGARGLTDDTASLIIGDGNEAVITLDTMVSGVHFLPTDPPDEIARKLLRVNLSDLAAAGATPRTYFLSLSLPSSITDSWIAAFAEGLAVDQGKFGIILGGGDTTSTPGPLTMSGIYGQDRQSARRRNARTGYSQRRTGVWPRYSASKAAGCR